MRRIKISPVKNHGVTKWQVIIPPDLGSGKRSRRFFDTQKEAQGLADQLNSDRGTMANGFHRLEPKHQEVVLRCLYRVDNDASVIEEALNLWLSKKNTDQTLTLERLSQECIASKESGGRRSSYIVKLRSALKAFVLPRRERLIQEITPSEIESFMNGNGWSAATRQGILRDLRTLFSFACRRKYLDDNPADRVDYPLREDKPPGILTVEQCRKILRRAAVSDTSIAKLVALQLFGGLRREEAWRISDVDILKDTVYVSALNKTRRKRFVPINPTLRAWLSLPGSLPIKNIHRRMRRLRGEMKEAQSKRGVRQMHVKDIPWSQNCLRHSFCSYSLPIHGASKTAEWAGHSEAILFRHYRELVTEEQAREFWGIWP